eukprot:TRINITY_DN85215_c0_g1_i1.p1 TRINITY_DN85215_c0_g1~~TRINITY_DN85215_c0_g1_i1.p1  ORF type:complete len:197 (+),score=30.55 TRINITY_DN85215_c0_g1_i1:65-592(+)
MAMRHLQGLPALLRRRNRTSLDHVRAFGGISKPRLNQATNPQIPIGHGQTLKQPHLVNPTTPTAEAPKLAVYDIGQDWTVIYTKAGRPYYFNRKTEQTQWAHPRTGVVTPPSAPPEEMQEMSPILKYSLRTVFFGVGGFMFLCFFGFATPLMRLWEGIRGGGGGSRVVQVSTREA